MSITLDGQEVFDRQGFEIELGSVRRDSAERTIAGLDGKLSIDMGGRGREIGQRGSLSAPSRAKMNERIGAISAFMDGDTHTLKMDDGEEYGNLRMDVFEVSKERASGSRVCCDYKIVYTQLVV